jgi:hypothetical protein
MIAVIFEVWPKAERRRAGLDIAAALRPELEAIDGFISVERFESLSEPGKLLSLSFWRDDAPFRAWHRLWVQIGYDLPCAAEQPLHKYTKLLCNLESSLREKRSPPVER